MKIICPIHLKAQQNPHQCAILTPKNKITYSELHFQINSAQHFLRNKGVQPSSRVGILSSTHEYYIVILFALWRLKAIACVLNTRNPIITIKEQLRKINAKFLITDNPKILSSKTIFVFQIPLTNFSKPIVYNLWPTANYKITQPATIMFTSGSSGEPKAALHSFGNHYYSALGSNKNIPVKPSTRWLLSLPLYHVSGIGILFRTFLGGGTVVIPDKIQEISQMLHSLKITHVSLITTQLKQLLNSRKKFPTLKTILLGGSPISENLIKYSLQKKIPIYISYGLTEMSSQVATSKNLLKSKFQAKILKYAQVRIWKDNEVWVKGKTLFQGYIKGNKTVKPFNTRGWFPTGDLGRISENKYLEILGRKDNMFISGGENIQPEEIEKYLKQIPEIEEAVVIPVKNQQFDLSPAAFIKWKNSQRISEKKIIKFLQQSLPKYKIPTKILNWPKLIHTGIKIDRKKFQALKAL